MKMFFAAAWILISTASSASTLYDNATDSPHLALIEGAEKSIDIEVYTMMDQKIQSAILLAQSRGVKIRIIEEPAPVGDPCKIFAESSSRDSEACALTKAFVSEIIANGGIDIPYDKTAFCNGKKTCYEHGKLMIIDRRLALISTGNFDPTSLCDASENPSRCNRDFSVVTEDVSEVGALQAVFEADLQGQGDDLQAIVNSLPKETLTISPYSLSPLVEFIGSAKTSLQIENQYLHDADLNQAIESAAARGVSVKVMVSSLCSFGKPSASEARSLSGLSSEFMNEGIDARAFTKEMKVNGNPGYLHAKTILIDGVKAWVGSVNGSATALEVNREFGIFISEPENIQALQKIMDSDFSDPASTSLSDDADCGSA